MMSNTGRQRLIAELEHQLSPKGVRKRQRARMWRTGSWLFLIRAAAVVRRLADVLLAALLVFLLSPVLVLLFAAAKMSGGGIARVERLGRWATTFGQYRFSFGRHAALSRRPFLAGLPGLCNVLRGEMAFIGPLPVSPDEIPATDRAAWKRYDLRPGFISLWWVRKRASIAYASEGTLDAEYADSHSFRKDLGIAVRVLPVLAFGQGVSDAPAQVRLLDMAIDNLTMSEAVERIAEMAGGTVTTQLCFVNADCANIAFVDASYKAIIQTADMVLADGIGMRLAGRLVNQHIRENVNGTDMFPILCEALQRKGLGIYLLGGRPGVPEGAAKSMAEKFPGLKIRGTRNGYFRAEEEPEVLRGIRESGAEVLLVAFGVPKQEKWIAAHKKELGVNVAMGVGGLFDFYSGRIPRAPAWMREVGMEWFYRFLQEPRRMWRRYFVGNAQFLYRVIREARRA